MSASNPLTLFDISSTVEPRSYAPNPSKARLALSFKRANFKTTFVDIPDIASVRQGLKVPAVRKFPDGSDFNTLPMLQDPSSGKVIGDSFDIANYLEETISGTGINSLFPSDSTLTGLDYESPNKDSMFYAPYTPATSGTKNEAYGKFNAHIDATFSAFLILVVQHMPFPPKVSEEVKSLFVKRAGMASWDNFIVTGETRENIRAGFKATLTSLAALYKVNDGPYLEGQRATYADLIVGGWLNFLSITTPAEEWKDLRTWHDGVFARLHDALQANYFECK